MVVVSSSIIRFLPYVLACVTAGGTKPTCVVGSFRQVVSSMYVCSKLRSWVGVMVAVVRVGTPDWRPSRFANWN